MLMCHVFCIALPMGESVDRLATANPESEDDEENETPIYEKYDHLLHGGSRSKKYVG